MTNHKRFYDQTWYEQAFALYAKCNKNDFEIAELFEDSSFAVKYRNHYYQVSHKLDLYDEVVEIMQSDAWIIDPYYWILACENVAIEQPAFQNALLKKVSGEDKKILQEVQKRIPALIKEAKENAEPPQGYVWFDIYKNSPESLYQKAVDLVLEQTKDKKALLESLFDLMCEEGVEAFAHEVENAVFEQVQIKDLRSKKDETFYIFSISPEIWEVED
jgi:DNA-binding ferritin-like protein (Dps family)